MSNLLIDIAPAVAEEWHPTKNTHLNLYQVAAQSKKKAWWVGKECGHEWETGIVHRTVGSGCSVCSGKTVLQGFNDLATTRPDLAEEWHPTKNKISTFEITKGSNKIFWWLSKECGHEWESKVSYRDDGGGCCYCSGRKCLQGFNDIMTYDPELASQWHPTKNGELTAKDVTYRTSKTYWWIGDCGHEWDAKVTHRVAGANCPFCASQRILVGFNDLASQNPQRAKKWHPTKNGNKTPDQITQWSKQRVWWRCIDYPDHEWQTSVSDGKSCPICSGQKTLAGFNDLESQSPDVAKTWHLNKNGELLPSMVTVSSNKPIWWICTRNHEWRTTPSERNRGYGCNKCSSRISKAEQHLASMLRAHGLEVEQSNRKILKGSELDIYIPEKKVAIEYNGVYWHTENWGKDKDYHRDKWLRCQESGIQLIQIWEDDWNRNPEQMESMILHKLGISTQKRVFARKTHIAKVFKSDVEEFLETNHVQGYARGTHYIGLVDNSTKELVAALVLLKEKDETLNIVRYATNANVVGGFTKLLAYAEKEYSPKRFITFSDHCVSDGSLYRNNGFVVDKELEPDYRYVVNGVREHKFGYRLKRFRNDPNLQWKEGLTERELAALNGLYRSWDAGKTRWMKKVE